jgi:sec-independent protein translocase protein TatC
MSDDEKLTFMGHLRELRSCLLRTVIALIVALLVCFCITYYFKDFVFGFLTAPAIEQLPELPIVFTEVTEMMATYIKVALYSALVLVLPFVIYQLVMFIRPALTTQERGYLYLLLPSIFVLFAAGAVFAYFVLLPPAFNFLLTFGGDVAEPMIKIGNYVSVLTRLVFWIGMCFEIPLILFFLTKIGVVRPEWLSKYRRFAYVAAFILGAIITPTFDPVNQSLVAVPIIFLYELGILLSKLARRKKAEPASADS